MKKITSLLTIGALSVGIQSASANLIFDGDFSAAGASKNIGIDSSWDFLFSTDVYSGNPVRGWQTTHIMDYMEVWAAPPSLSPLTHFAEMNAGEVSSLYQVVTAPNSNPFDIFFQHSGRNGIDTAGVSLFDLGTATSWPRGSGTLVYQTVFSTGMDWTTYSADNVFTPVSGRNYALVFDSISAAGGDATIGNFLTDVQFGAWVYNPSATPLTPQSFTLSYATGGGGGGTAAVPEPGQVAASLLLLGGIGGYVFLKRRKSAKAAVAIG